MKVLCVDMLLTRLDLLSATVSFRKEVTSYQVWSLRHPPQESMKTLADFLITEKLEVDKIAMGIPGSLCSYHNFSVPFKKSKDLIANVPFEIEERVPFQPEDIYHTFQVLSKSATQSEILATIIPKKLYNEFIEKIRLHQLEPEILTPAPIALAYSLLPIGKKLSGPVLCLEVRDTTTYIAVTYGPSVLVCRTYPMGLTSFVVPEATLRNISYDQAYDELKSSGPNLPKEGLSDSVRDIIKPFFVEIKKTILNVRATGHPYISKILLSGYATAWASFEDLLFHEFNIALDRHPLYEEYKDQEKVPSLINHGLLSHFTSPSSTALINLRTKELRAQQSIQELVSRYNTPEQKTTLKYMAGTLALVFLYLFSASLILSMQRDRVETRLKETVKKVVPELQKYQALGKSTLAQRTDEIQATLDRSLVELRSQVSVLSQAGTDSTLDHLKKFVDSVPRDWKSDLKELSISEKDITADGIFVEGDLEQFRKRLRTVAGWTQIKKLDQKDGKFSIVVTYE